MPDLLTLLSARTASNVQWVQKNRKAASDVFELTFQIIDDRFIIEYLKALPERCGHGGRADDAIRSYCRSLRLIPTVGIILNSDAWEFWNDRGYSRDPTNPDAMIPEGYVPQFLAG